MMFRCVTRAFDVLNVVKPYAVASQLLCIVI